MYCPRYRHFVRLNANGTFGMCGHMTNAPEFDTLHEVELWGQSLGDRPDVCIRCWELEDQQQPSVRQAAKERDIILSKIKHDYLIVGGTLDNYCNSACLTCNSGLSTKIAKLEGSNLVINNYDKFKQLPQERIVELDISGGEPTYSKNYKKLLDNLPPNVKIIRLNTNGSTYFNKVEELLQRKIKVIVTLSLDGTEKVHDFIRWPVLWTNYKKTVEQYLTLRAEYKNLSLDFWTTLSILNLKDFKNIQQYAHDCKIPHQYSLLKQPSVLGINNNDIEKLNIFLEKQTALRRIKWQP